ncbi:MAG: carbohydrate kinase family protein [Candidatus Woesearchaeota archaeon]|jgi:ribokinase|nr:carbohydrate kinase family protein [Candidatus Woesearchaeota archaeon]|tara:strand:+ start:29272 stop:30255 length:984 start_codon:yes stop_codon:yes gene_type:complete
MYDVITVGSATVDVFAKTEFSELLRGVNREECIAYPVGSKILIDELIITSGGGGTNTAVSLSRLGHKVAFLGKIGSQENSHRVRLELRKENIDMSLVVRSKNSRTGYSIILDSIKHDRTILTFRGSNDDLRYNEINLKKLKTKWFMFTSMIGNSFKTLEKLASYAVRNKIKLAFVLSSYLARKGVRNLRGLLRKVDILILNKDEASILLGKYKIEKLLKKLCSLGPRIVAITDGGKGVYVYDSDYLYFAKPNKIKVVETTGAGDAFASSFLSGIIRKKDIQFAIRLGMTNAESVIKHHGAKNDLLRYKEALKVMKREKFRIHKKKIQ